MSEREHLLVLAAQHETMKLNIELIIIWKVLYDAQQQQLRWLKVRQKISGLISCELNLNSYCTLILIAVTCHMTVQD